MFPENYHRKIQKNISGKQKHIFPENTQMNFSGKNTKGRKIHKYSDFSF